jgi:ankyrin repeat protein
LHAAAHANQRAIAELLIAHGADIHAINLNGRTPLAETEFHKAKPVANLLKQHGAPA